MTIPFIMSFYTKEHQKENLKEEAYDKINITKKA